MATRQRDKEKPKNIKALDFTAKVRKWGNSYAIHIPSKIMDSYGLKEGDKVRIPRVHKDMDLERIKGMLKGSRVMSERDIEE